MSTKTKKRIAKPKKEGVIPAGINNFLCREDIAAIINVSVGYFDHMRLRGRFPEPDRPLGKRQLWSRKLVEKWLDDDDNFRDEAPDGDGQEAESE